MTVEQWLQAAMRNAFEIGRVPGERAGWPHERFRRALADRNASAADLVVLLRGVLRSESIDRGFSWELELPESLFTKLKFEFERAGIEFREDLALRARSWRPSWVTGAAESDIDQCVRPTQRRSDERCSGDPMLEALGLSDYSSNAQRDAVRAVFCASPGDTLV